MIVPSWGQLLRRWPFGAMMILIILPEKCVVLSLWVGETTWNLELGSSGFCIEFCWEYLLDRQKQRKHTRYVTVNTRVVCLCLSSDGMVDGRDTERDLSITKRPGFYASWNGLNASQSLLRHRWNKGKTKIEILLPPKLTYPLKNAGWVRCISFRNGHFLGDEFVHFRGL